MSKPFWIRTNQPDLVARHLQSRKTGEPYWRIYLKRRDRNNRVDAISERQEGQVNQCELCGTLNLLTRERFCSEACGKESLRRENMAFEEKMFDLGIPVTHYE